MTLSGLVLLHVTPSRACLGILADLGLLPLSSQIRPRPTAGHVSFEIRLALYLNCCCFSAAGTLFLKNF